MDKITALGSILQLSKEFNQTPSVFTTILQQMHKRQWVQNSQITDNAHLE